MPIRKSTPNPADGMIQLARAAKARLRDGIERAQQAARTSSEGDIMSSKESFADKLKREGMKDVAEGKLKHAEGKVRSGTADLAGDESAQAKGNLQELQGKAEEQWGKAQKKAGELLDRDKDKKP
ncbi:MAG TPA: CsbD family protein [Gemmatimonadales bacterium]|nr:CsbD family protein [Gemmatimonadales bacterium]